MHSSMYESYMRSPEWEKKRKERLAIDGYKCVMCGRPLETCKKKSLDVHHISYENLGNENVYTDLVTLCSTCHRNLHKYLKRITKKGECTA